MEIGNTSIIVGTIILVAIAFLALKLNVRLKKRATVVAAIIDIFSSSSHHIEYLPPTGVARLDLIQLAVSYFANINNILPNDPVIARDALLRLVEVITPLRGEDFDATKYRSQLDILVKSLSKGTQGGIKHRTIGTSERFTVNLIRGKTFDYVLSDFSAIGFKPNIGNSAVFLYCNIAATLDDKSLLVLNESLQRFIHVATEYKLNRLDSGITAYNIVQQLKPFLETS